MNDNNTEEQQTKQEEQNTEGEQPTAKAKKILKKMPAIQFEMDFMRNPDEAIKKWETSEGTQARYYKTAYLAPIYEAAEKLGIDPEQLADQEKQTPEQRLAVMEAIANRYVSRMYEFITTIYADALFKLHGINELNTYFDEEISDPLNTEEEAILYFFAVHDDIKPTDKGKLTSKQYDELIDIFNRLTSFYEERGEVPHKADSFIEFIEQENPKMLGKIPNIQPAHHIMPNTYLINDIQQNARINSGAYDLPVIPKNKRTEEITAYVMIQDTTNIVKSLSEHERSIINAYCSIYTQAIKDGQIPVFTIDSLYRAMPGKGTRASTAQKKEIENFIARQRSTLGEIDITSELQARGKITDTEKYKFNENFLMAREGIYETTGGRPVKAWEILEEPLMLKYAKLNGQLISVPAKHLEIEKVTNGKLTHKPISMSQPRQAILSYMLRRISIINHDYDKAEREFNRYNRQRERNKSLKEKTISDFRIQSDKILFDTIFETAGITIKDRAQLKDNRDFCYNVLDYWKISGLITGYQKLKKGQTAIGIIIEH